MPLIHFLISIAFASYPTELRQEFISSCVNSGGTTEYCGCTMDNLERTVSLQDFQSGSQKMQLGTQDTSFQSRLAEAAKSCLTPDMYRAQFVPACQSQGASARYCNCNFEYLHENLGHSRLIDLSFDIQMGKSSAEFAKAAENAAASCHQPAEYKQFFVSACSKAGASNEVCSCMHDYFVQELGFENLIRYDSRMTNGQQVPEFEAVQSKAQVQCIK